MKTYIVIDNVNIDYHVIEYKKEVYLRCPNHGSTIKDPFIIFTKDSHNIFKKCRFSQQVEMDPIEELQIKKVDVGSRVFARTHENTIESVVTYHLLKTKLPNINNLLGKTYFCANVIENQAIGKELTAIRFQLMIDYSQLAIFTSRKLSSNLSSKEVWEITKDNIEQQQFLSQHGYYYTCPDRAFCPYSRKDKRMFFFLIKKITNKPLFIRGMYYGFLASMGINNKINSKITEETEETIGSLMYKATSFISGYWYDTKNIFFRKGFMQAMESLESLSLLPERNHEAAHQQIEMIFEFLSNPLSYKDDGVDLMASLSFSRFAKGQKYQTSPSGLSLNEDDYMKNNNFDSLIESTKKNKTKDDPEYVPKILFVALGAIISLGLALIYIYLEYS